MDVIPFKKRTGISNPILDAKLQKSRAAEGLEATVINIDDGNRATVREQHDPYRAALSEHLLALRRAYECEALQATAKAKEDWTYRQRVAVNDRDDGRFTVKVTKNSFTIRKEKRWDDGETGYDMYDTRYSIRGRLTSRGVSLTYKDKTMLETLGHFILGATELLFAFGNEDAKDEAKQYLSMYRTVALEAIPRRYPNHEDQNHILRRMQDALKALPLACHAHDEEIERRPEIEQYRARALHERTKELKDEMNTSD